MMRGTRIRVALAIGDGCRPGKRWSVHACVVWLEQRGLIARGHGPSQDTWWYKHYPDIAGGNLSMTAKGVRDVQKAIAEHEAKGTGWVVSGRQPGRQLANRVLSYKFGRAWGESKDRVFHE